MRARQPLFFDANVLIDYAKTDRTVLALCVQHLGPVHVARRVLDEVDDLEEPECQRLGVLVADGSVEQHIEAGARRGQAGLSFQDHLCLILARDAGGSLVTNDVPLRKECALKGVRVIWGLELLLSLVGGGGLSPATAIAIAHGIAAVNPRYITPKILDEFTKKARASGST